MAANVRPDTPTVMDPPPPAGASSADVAGPSHDDSSHNMSALPEQNGHPSPPEPMHVLPDDEVASVASSTISSSSDKVIFEPGPASFALLRDPDDDPSLAAAEPADLRDLLSLSSFAMDQSDVGPAADAAETKPEPTEPDPLSLESLLSADDLLEVIEVGRDGQEKLELAGETIWREEDLWGPQGAQILQELVRSAVQRRREEAEDMDVAGPTLKCSLCEFAVKDEVEALQHIVWEHKDQHRTSTCTLCLTSLSHESSLKKHIKNVHFRAEEFECPYCHKSIQQRNHLRRHVERVHSKKVSDSGKDFACHVCRRRFLNKKAKERHVRLNHRGAKKAGGALRCEDCGKAYWPKEQLDLHRRQQHGVVAVPLAEGRANHKADSISSNGSGSSNSRSPACHVPLRTLKCGLCSKEVYSSMHLKAHLRTHTNETVIGGAGGGGGGASGGGGKRKGVATPCDYCQEMLRSNEMLLSHVESNHAYECSQCPRHFQTYSGLRKHYRKVHFLRKRQSCLRCGDSFAGQQELRTHLLNKHAWSPGKVALYLQQQQQQQQGGQTKQEQGGQNGAGAVPLSPGKENENAQSRRLAFSARDAGMEFPGKCQFCYCDEVFHAPDAFEAHVGDAHPFQCPLCPYKMVKLPSSIRKHCRIKHHKLRPTFCKTCTLVFVTEAEAERHKDSCVGAEAEADGAVNGGAAASGDHVLQTAPGNLPAAAEAPPQSPVSGQPAPNDTPHKPGQASNSSVRALRFADDEAADADSAEQREFACPYCERSYANPDSLRKHSRTVHSESLCTCRACFMVFTDLEARKEHLRTEKHMQAVGGAAHSEGGGGDASMSSLAEHSFDSVYLTDSAGGEAESMETTTVQLDDSAVAAAAPEQQAVEMEVEVTTPAATAAASSGGDVVVKIVSPAKERRQSQPTGPAAEPLPLYQCPYCDKSYDVANSMSRHSRKVHGPRVWLCQVCRLVFAEEEAYEAHMQSGHDGTAPILAPALAPAPAPDLVTTPTPTSAPVLVTSPAPGTPARQLTPTKPAMSPATPTPVSLVVKASSATTATPANISTPAKAAIRPTAAATTTSAKVEVKEELPRAVAPTASEPRKVIKLKQTLITFPRIATPSASSSTTAAKTPTKTPPKLKPAVRVSLTPKKNAAAGADNSDPTWLQCLSCEQRRPTYELLLTHLKDSHFFACPLCPKGYKHYRSLQKHFRVHHDRPVEQLHSCQDCGESFLSDEERTTHREGGGCRSAAESNANDPIHSRASSPDFHGFGTPTKEAEQLESMREYRRDLAKNRLKFDEDEAV